MVLTQGVDKDLGGGSHTEAGIVIEVVEEDRQIPAANAEPTLRPGGCVGMEWQAFLGGY